jgi:predicted Rossmann fold nucleotide-binding protein DprA/Smf involved in DNA uptake
MAPDLLSTIRREIDERLSELRPRLAEYEQLLVAADALLAESAASVAQAIPEAVPDMPEKPASAKPKPARAVRGAAREAILAALEHGSHTIGELAVVTAMSGPNINGNLRRLAAEGAVVKTEREGKAAWALPTA